jgi:putative FmdB family regulatory protein
MPTYEFRCPEGHEFEKFYRSISGAESTAACPVCGERAERMMSAAGFAFKGSGFYLTDYGKNAHRGEAPPDAKAAAAADNGSASPKPEGKSEGSSSSENAKSSSDNGKSDSPKSSEAAKPAAETKKSEPKSTEPKAAATPKPSAGE